jgi:hypothetical protein
MAGADVGLREKDWLECWAGGIDIADLWIWLRIVGVDASNHARLV